MRTLTTALLAREIQARLPDGIDRPAVVAIDGRSGSGKSTLARALASAMTGAVVVGTDDLAWHHSFFGWADLLVDDVLSPIHAGCGVEFRPPAWSARERAGAVRVPADAPVWS